MKKQLLALGSIAMLFAACSKKNKDDKILKTVEVDVERTDSVAYKNDKVEKI